MKNALLLFLTCIGVPQLFALAGCPAGTPVANFQLQVQPEEGGTPRNLREIQNFPAGGRILYRPSAPLSVAKSSSEIALIRVQDSDGSVDVEEPRPASKDAEWVVPAGTRLIALAWGPRGLDRKKVESRIEKQAGLIEQLADYAARTERTETAIAALMAPATSSGEGSWNALLEGFASQMGGKQLSRSAPTEQQTIELLRAVNPALSRYDPLAPDPASRMKQSAGLATTVAALFFGDSVGLTAGSAALFVNLRNVLFPKTDFRSSLLQPAGPSEVALCGAREGTAQAERVAYLWAMRLPDRQAPKLKLAAPARLPVTGRGNLFFESASPDWQLLRKVSDWRLSPAAGEDGPQVTVKVGVSEQGLQVETPGAALTPGEWLLEGNWDWETVSFEQAIQVLPPPSIESIAVSLAKETGVALREGELPAGFFASISLRVLGAGERPAIELGCPSSTPVTLRPGEQRPGLQLDQPAAGLLFLSLDPGSLGPAGCVLNLVVEGETGRSDPRPVGRVVRLPRIESFRLTDEKLGGNSFAGILEGRQLEAIEKAGWTAEEGAAVEELPSPAPGAPHKQALRLALPWPSPAPHAPLYIWLRGETGGRATTARY